MKRDSKQMQTGLLSVSQRTSAQHQKRSLTDEDLMEQIKNGDQNALSVLYDAHAPTVLGLLTRILGNRQTAEEVLQETFWRVWDKANTFDSSKGSARTWLYSIARRLAIDTHRKRTIRPEASSDEDASVTAAQLAGESNVVATVSARMTATTVRGALSELSNEQRTVIEMAYFDGKTRREIADETGVALGTIHTRARLGLKKLQTILEKRGVEGDNYG